MRNSLTLKLLFSIIIIAVFGIYSNAQDNTLIEKGKSAKSKIKFKQLSERYSRSASIEYKHGKFTRTAYLSRSVGKEFGLGDQLLVHLFSFPRPFIVNFEYVLVRELGTIAFEGRDYEDVYLVTESGGSRGSSLELTLLNPEKEQFVTLDIDILSGEPPRFRKPDAFTNSNLVQEKDFLDGVKHAYEKDFVK